MNTTANDATLFKITEFIPAVEGNFIFLVKRIELVLINSIPVILLMKLVSNQSKQMR